MTVEGGYAIITDLNKCLGCQACAIACKEWWTSKEEGADHAWWIIVETRPGAGYPRNWLDKKKRGERLAPEDFEQRAEFKYDNLINNPTGEIPPKITPEPLPSWGPNWDWDIGEGETPSDAWFFYLPIQCMHCDDAPCVDSCPSHALYRRDDGVVMFDPQLCMGCQACFETCPYARVFWNYVRGMPTKCIMCAPLLDKGEEPICVHVCPARARFFGRVDDPSSPVYTLVEEYGVALPLLPQFNTNPRVLYIPPVLLPPKPDGTPRYDERLLEELFGKEVWRVKEVLERERQKGENSKLMRVLTGYKGGV
ncbi:MAG TPA: respiratory nitrate reductase subunit beta [Candidatus Korarchaeota archaeon]|nr:respiratory nitrate reductase subunit beta [Candidatus Korarchaeota archaeon]